MSVWTLIAEGWQEVAAAVLVVAAAVYLVRRLWPSRRNRAPSPCGHCSSCSPEKPVTLQLPSTSDR